MHDNAWTATLSCLAQKESDLNRVLTPCLDDHQLNEEDFAEKGELGKTPARLVRQLG